MGWLAQAGISAGIGAVTDFANQTVDILQSEKTFAEYDIGDTVIEVGLGFVTSAVGSAVSKVVDSKILKLENQSRSFQKLYSNKISKAEFRKQAGKSTSALIRQANRFLSKSDFYLNLYRGTSSAIGSVVSLWNIAR